ncbi:MAG: rhodanese-like domain-containing protein, partial [Solirubrobacteraceae bacterium]
MGSPLTSVAQLAAALGGERAPTLLDVRFDVAAGALRDDYERGHIPGAAFVDLDADLAGEPGAGGRHPLPEPALFLA